MAWPARHEGRQSVYAATDAPYTLGAPTFYDKGYNRSMDHGFIIHRVTVLNAPLCDQNAKSHGLDASCNTDFAMSQYYGKGRKVVGNFAPDMI